MILFDATTFMTYCIADDDISGTRRTGRTIEKT